MKRGILAQLRTVSALHAATVACVMPLLGARFSFAADATIAQLNDPANRPAIVLPRGVEVPANLDDPDLWQRWIEQEAAGRRLTLDGEYRAVARAFREQARLIRGQNKDGAGVFWPAVLAQVVHETGFFQYLGDVPRRITPDGRPLPKEATGGVPTYNFTGIGVTSVEVAKAKEENRAPGEQFPSIEHGALASLQHIGTYGGLVFDRKTPGVPDILVAKRTRMIQGFIPQRVKGFLDARRAAGVANPEITIADLGAQPDYRPEDQVKFRPGAAITVETLYGPPVEVDPSSTKWKVVDVERRDGAVARLEICRADGASGWVNIGDVQPFGKFAEFRRGSLNYAGDREYGAKVLGHWIAGSEFVRREYEKAKAAERPAPRDLATQIEPTSPAPRAVPSGTPSGTAEPGPTPPKPDPRDLARQIEMIGPARPPTDTAVPEVERGVPPNGTPQPATPPVGRASKEVEPFYAVYDVHPIVVPQIPAAIIREGPDKLTGWMADRTVKDFTVAAKSGGRIAFRVEGTMLDEFASHRRTTPSEPFRYFRPGPYRLSVHLFHPDAGHSRLPPVCLTFVKATNELTDDIGGAFSYPYTIPPEAGTLSGERIRVDWSVPMIAGGRLAVDPPTYDRESGQSWPTARQEAFEGWKRMFELIYSGFAK